MAKHSPEPWHVGGVGGCRPKLVYDASGRTIMRSWGNGSDEENEANMQLAAKAPKLREQVHALREALQKAHEGLDSAARYFDKLDSQTVVDAVEEALQTVSAALEATKEGGAA